MAKKNSGMTMFLIIMVGICLFMCSGFFTTKKMIKPEGYSNTKPKMTSGMIAPSNKPINMGVNPAEPLGQNMAYKAINEIDTRMTRQSQNPLDLLPKDENSAWAELNPMGKGELDNINLLSPGHHIGINTIGTSKRNSNLQIRGEYPNPKQYTGPWNNSTIDQPTNARKPEVL
jgi:uncharacterized protein YneF (UPF0154 family)